MKPTFEKTVDVLVNAYLNDTLEHANCTACAVGNLIAHAKGTTPVLSFTQSCSYGDNLARFADGSIPKWLNVFCSTTPRNQRRNPDAYEGETKDEIDSTGYTWLELAAIEYAFEKDCNRTVTVLGSQATKDAQMFWGLMNVIDALARIHGIDLEAKESAKLLFQKA